MKNTEKSFTGGIGMLALIFALSHSAAAVDLRAFATRFGNEILFTDSQAAVLKTSTASEGAQVVASGQKLMQPFGICVCANGEYLVSDTGCMGLVAVNPATGEQRLVTSGGILGSPFGVATEKSGTVLVANSTALIRVDPTTGAQTHVTSGGYFQLPVAVAVGTDGYVYVADLLGSVIRVNPKTGGQKLVSRGGLLQHPQGIAVHGTDIYVTDVASSGVGRIVHINTKSGEQDVVSEGANLSSPVGIGILATGDLVVADPNTVSPDTGSFDGAVVLVGAADGQQHVIARGQQDFVNPRCVSVLTISAVE